MSLNIEKIDHNLKVEPAVGEKDVVFYDAKNEPFDLYGFYMPQIEPEFKRLPDGVAKNVSQGVASLYKNTAGGRVRFCTDSRYIAIKVEFSHFSHMSHMPLLSSAGFDIYLDCPQSGTNRFYDVFKPAASMKDGFESKIVFGDRKLRYVTINFPSYSSVTSLKIGLQQGATVGHGLLYRNMLPIVYYGSSITQGACSSRPGNAFANIISRRTNTDFLNLGFSGSARGEEAIAQYIAMLPMSVFVSDFDHNHNNADELQKLHWRLYEIIREKNPDLPYLILSRPDFNKRSYGSISVPCRDAIYENYRRARSIGDKNVYFIDGSSIFRNANEDMCTVDTTHPNDYGFHLMADAIECELRWIWAKNEAF